MNLATLAFRNLVRHRRRTVISLAAMCIGVAAMVTFRGFINGQRELMLEGMVKGQLGALQVHKKGYLKEVQALPIAFDFEDSPALRETIRSTPGVLAVAPRISFGGMLSLPDTAGKDGEPEPGKTTFLVATAIDPAAERQVTPTRFGWVDRGRFFTDLDAPELVLNSELVKSVKTALSPDARSRPPEESWPALLAPDRDGSLNGANVVVSGTLRQMMPGDRKMGLLPLGLAQQVLRMPGRVTEYGVAVHDVQRASQVRDELSRRLGPDFEVHTWEELMPFIRDMMRTQDFLLGLLSSIFLFVVLLGILNSMLMNVLERVREIGTMLAVGTRKRQVVAVFVWEGLFLGVAGGVVGALLGVAIVSYFSVRGIYINAPGTQYDSVIRPSVQAVHLAFACVVSSVGSALAALGPAMRAAKLRPVEALRSV